MRRFANAIASLHATVTNNPYQLATDIYGIGFLTADKIAQNLGVPPNSEFRYRAGLVHVLSEAAEQGHCYLPQPSLVESALSLLNSNEITLAWAVTTHKSQGSEYPLVILPLYMQHYLMLSRNLLYTGLTRAKKLAIVIGAKKAIGLALNQTNQQQRYTRLQQRLIQADRHISNF